MKSRSRPGGAASTSDDLHTNYTASGLQLDHLQLVTQRPARRAAVAGLRKLSNGTGLRHVQVWHEPRYECCRIEPWAVTAGRLARMLHEDGVAALWVFLGGRS